ncbi:MAG: succinylglutamate desuccinylase/aspartoacylase family protein [Candidatus Pacebacteria bacterium]|nr:succinylglutamate desuccinylase/aspartoacylase family protein [Candidatus Paceibacterota bacterium]
MREEVIRITGSMPGPTSVILAGVHGNEPCGLQAFEELFVQDGLKIEWGTVFLVVGNPNAVAKNMRFTEFDLNRAFMAPSAYYEWHKHTYEYHRAGYLKSYLDEAGALLDIHSSDTPESKPFAICEQNGIFIAEKLPVEIIVSGFDQVCPGGTDEYMNRAGRIGVCVECGHHEDPSVVSKASLAIFGFLHARGHITLVEDEMDIISKERVQIEEIYHTTASGFKRAREWKDFEPVNKGEIIGHDGDVEVTAKKDGLILFADDCDGVGKEAFYFGCYC